MIKSIRTKLFLSMGLLILFFVLFSIFLNSQYLGKYYTKRKLHILVENQQMISEIYNGQPETVAFVLEKLERNSGINVFILDQDFQLKYSSIFNGNRDGIIRRSMERMPFIGLKVNELKGLSTGEYSSAVMIDPRLNTKFIILTSRIANGDYVILTTPLAAINESTAIASRFFLFTGLITMVIGGVIVYIFANKFTKPILVLNDIAQGMSKLDFSKKYPVQSDDEIGQLGKSINSLSEQLDKSITELTEANSKLMEDIERERRIDEMRKDFISNVSHELKTPIALIQGYAEGLKLNLHEDVENKNFYCEVIMDEADKMNRLVKDLMNLSQIESGYFKLERIDFDLTSMLDNLLEKYRPIILEKGINIETEREENIIVNGDEVRIEQVLINYLNNAINHVDENKLIKISLVPRGDKVRVEVYNSGPNIPEEALEKIWMSFYKVDKARTRAYGGTGLGLSVVRGIQELHKNSFGVQNNPEGVTFWFEIDKV